jgi:hypothetical protein
MIREIFLYLTTPASKQAKIFGHLYEAIALGARENRCQVYWKSHREESQRLILKVVQKIVRRKSLLILGSGPLHEIPIIELSKLFESITLVDIVHLKDTKKKYQQLHNLSFVEHDITELECNISNEKKVMNKVPTTFLNNHYDLVISANILSQLAYHLRGYLEKTASPRLSSETLDQFSNQISLDHFQYLKNFSCPVLLITDIETYFKNPDNETIDRQSPYMNLDLPSPVATWLWDVAPIPEYNPEISLQMKVAGFILNQ